jgi:uncharacterized protein
MSTANPAARIRTAREIAGLSQRELARRSGVPQPHISAIETRRVTPTPPMVERLLAATRIRPSVALDRNRERVREIVASHGGSNARIFGSVARGEDTVGSDLDLLVSFEPATTIFDVAALVDDLEQALGVPVQVVGDSGEGAVLQGARSEAVAV